MPADKLLRVHQVAEILNMSAKSIYNRSGRKSSHPLPFRVIRIGSRIRFSENEILNLVKEGTVNGNYD